MISSFVMEDNLARYLDQWMLEAPRPLAHTPTADVYIVSWEAGDAVLKILTPLGQKDEADGTTALRYFAGDGAVRLLREDTGACLLEYAAGESLLQTVKAGRDDAAAEIIGQVLNRLHAPRDTPPPPLRDLARYFKSLFDKADHGDIFRQAAATAEKLLSSPRDVTVLHGDIHHENILQSSRGWVAIDPKGVVGERTFDAANALCNPARLPQLVQDQKRLLKQAAILADTMGIDRARLLDFGFAFAGLSAAWSMEDGQDPAHALKMAGLFRIY